MNRHERSRLVEEYFNEAAETYRWKPYKLLPNTLQRCIEHTALRFANRIKAEVAKIIEEAVV